MQSATALEIADASCPDSKDFAGLPRGRSLAPKRSRVDLDSDTVQHDLARLVLGLVEVVRQLIERQALRRVDGGRLTPAQIEKLGLTLMRLEERMDELKEHFGVTGEELRLDLGKLVDEV